MGSPPAARSRQFVALASVASFAMDQEGVEVYFRWTSPSGAEAFRRVDEPGLADADSAVGSGQSTPAAGVR